MQVTLGRAVPVPVPRAGAYWRPSRTVWAGFSIKTFGHKKQKQKFEEVAPVDLHAHERATCNHGKVEHILLSSASGCSFHFDFLFLGYFCKSINLLDTAIFHING
jgi:hypothetical protein